MMKTLMSKDVLSEPMGTLKKMYPPWLADRKGEVTGTGTGVHGSTARMLHNRPVYRGLKVRNAPYGHIWPYWIVRPP